MDPRGKLITQNFLICILQILDIIHLRCKILLTKHRHLIQHVMNCAVKDNIMHIILKQMFTFAWKIFFFFPQKGHFLFTDWEKKKKKK